MNIELRSINQANYMACIDLKVSKEQEDFVAPNMFSLAQAAYEPDAYPLGIYQDEQMVGFILYGFDNEDLVWGMSRFMIDQAYQNQGIGSAALEKFIKLFYAKHGRMPFYTSASVDNESTIKWYEKFGFIKGDVFEYEADGKLHKEVEMVLDV